MKKLLFVGGLLLLGGCHSRGLDRILGNGDAGTPYSPPRGPAAVPNAVPVYDHTTATTAEDDNLILKVIGTPGTSNFNLYVSESWLPDRLNGIDNFLPGTGANSILVDAWKALYRRGYADVSKLKDPAVIHSNVYPVPVYQGDKTAYGL